MEGGNRGFFKGMALLASLGISMVIATFIGLAIGIYLDRYLSTSPIFTIIFMVLGIAAGFRNIYLLVKRYGF
ncbi:MAG: AtpZ/AtpI family protein [Deltaproteobacteria bacterium]|nr:AtpZ/AtpI family protein [Deltaproteobacteria bacterium]